MAKRLLFYYPSNKQSNALETTFKEMKAAGNEVIFLSTCERGILHEKLESFGISTYGHPISGNNRIAYYLRQILYLIKFCRKHQIEVVFSNLQHVNFIAVFAQFFIRAKVYIFRHHFKFNKGNFGIPLKVNKTEAFFDKVINLLAKKIIVPSSGVYNGMLKYENVDKKKLAIIPYLYDFKQYKTPDAEKVEEIKSLFSAKIRLIMVSRLIPFKRHALILPIVKKLIDEGLDIKMFILDEGPEKEVLNQYIVNHKLNDYIELVGYRTNVIDYMQAADLIIHPSITEASNNTIKEIGLLGKAVAVCRGVGDFDDYIVDEQNGYFMNVEQPEVDAEKIIRTIYNSPELIEKVGEKLKVTINEKFGDYEAIKNQHLDLLN